MAWDRYGSDGHCNARLSRCLMALGRTWTGLSFGAVLEAAGLNDLFTSLGSADGTAQSFLAFPAALGLLGAGLLVAGIGSGARFSARKWERARRN